MKKEERIRLLIADDSINYRKKLAELITQQPDMEVVSLVSDGEEAVKEIKELKPDIAIIDLLMPLRDGLGVLEEMRKERIHDTVCILISAIGLDSIAKKAAELGAQYYMIKPYRNEFLLGRIRQVYEENFTFNKDKIQMPLEEYGSDCSDSIILENKTPEQRISHFLSLMNVSASIKGYYYLRNAILMVLEDQEATIGITKRMYPDLAKMYHTTSNKVERAIRHAIESAWKKGADKTYCEILGIQCPDRPTNGQFIAAVGEYLRLSYKDKFELKLDNRGYEFY